MYLNFFSFDFIVFEDKKWLWTPLTLILTQNGLFEQILGNPMFLIYQFLAMIFAIMVQ